MGGVEQLISDGRVGEAGLCDLHPPVFMHVYNMAQIKPISIQINLRSCCVVPEELSVFAKENDVTLYTHSDPTKSISRTAASCFKRDTSSIWRNNSGNIIL